MCKRGEIGEVRTRQRISLSAISQSTSIRWVVIPHLMRNPVCLRFWIPVGVYPVQRYEAEMTREKAGVKLQNQS